MPSSGEASGSRSQYNLGMVAALRVILGALALLGLTAAQPHVSFPTDDGGIVYANEYGKGDRGVLLAHGGRFNKESWGRLS